MMYVEDELYQSYLSPKVQANFYSAFFLRILKQRIFLYFFLERKFTLTYPYLPGFLLVVALYTVFLNFFSSCSFPFMIRNNRSITLCVVLGQVKTDFCFPY